MKIIKQLTSSVWVMAILGVVLIIGSLIVSFGVWDGFYTSLFVIIPVIAFSAVMIWCVVRYPFSIKKIGFFACHVGILVIIVSAFVSWGSLKDTSFAIPVNRYAFYGQVMQNDGSELDFGFEVSVASFKVEKYDPDYSLYDSDGKLLIETVIQNRKGIFDLGEHGRVSAEQLKKDGVWLPTYKLENGMRLVKLPEVDKSYEAVLQIRDGDVHTETVGVNDPYTYKGWKFYLMGYDEENLQYVNLYVKKDPANVPFAIGIWMVIVGTFLECFPFNKRKGAKNERS